MKVEVKAQDGTLIEVVDRKPLFKMIGNFCPCWIRYKNRKHYVNGGIDYAYMHGDNPLGIPYYIILPK